MENKADSTSSGAGERDGIDPRSQLTMLERVQNATEVEAWMPPTPLWHAPLLAAVIAGTALVASGPGPGWAIGGGIVGGIALLVGCGDQMRRSRVRPRRLRKPLRVFSFYFVMTVIVLVILSVWNMVEWPSSLGAQIVSLGGMWLVTTVAFALGIGITNRLRDRWADAPR